LSGVWIANNAILQKNMAVPYQSDGSERSVFQRSDPAPFPWDPPVEIRFRPAHDQRRSPNGACSPPLFRRPRKNVALNRRTLPARPRLQANRRAFVESKLERHCYMRKKSRIYVEGSSKTGKKNHSSPEKVGILGGHGEAKQGDHRTGQSGAHSCQQRIPYARSAPANDPACQEPGGEAAA